MDKWITRFRGAKTGAGFEKVLIPGDPEREWEAVRRQEGIPLHSAVVADLQAVTERFGVPLNF